ncbi:fasciclin domain-containing protein [Spongiivirga sp. MCCC 1A20706]|uniref:fasciclin domain-containing protein n=1 Tax=Spongiivirga sp. MCCC 1A20706 TaxID=3160963 RepID=UPI003977B7DC
MKSIFKKTHVLFLAITSFVAFSCNDDDDGGPAVPTSNIVELAIANDNLTQLEAAVIKADLVDTLSGDGPFTVFAPTDTAFQALLDVLGSNYNSIDDFDTDGEIALLRSILLYHVVPSQVLANDLAAGDVSTALTDNSIEIIASGDTFVIGDASDTNANIAATDVLATNGVVHVIDKVLLPQAALDFVATLKDIVGIAQADTNFSVLVDAVIKADLVTTLQSEGPFTVFAPQNDAFVALLDALGPNYNSLDDFDEMAEIDLLRNILLYHVVPAQVKSGDLAAGTVATALTDNSIEVIESGGTFVIGDASMTDASLVATDVEATNGVVHVVSKVLLPQEAVDFAAMQGM